MLHHSGVAILAGDCNQISPLIKCRGQSAEYLQASPLEIQVTHKRVNIHQLKQNRRSHPGLVHLLNHTTYCCKLKPNSFGEDKNNQTDLPTIPWLYKLIPLFFVMCLEKDTLVGTSYNNFAEARAVARWAYCLISKYGIPWTKITIISFYRAQRNLIQSQLVNLCLSNHNASHMVSTVDKYQGTESDYLILSAV